MVISNYEHKKYLFNSQVASNLSDSLLPLNLLHNPKDLLLMGHLRNIEDKSLYETSLLNRLINIYNFKEVNKLFLELAFNKPIQDIYFERLQARNILHQANTRLINIKFDYVNVNKYPIAINNKILPIMRSIDTNQYIYVNKKPLYQDLSIKKILKRLLNTHSIDSFLYKDSIKRLNSDKPLKSKVRTKIRFYLLTLKAHKSKTTISALIRQSDKRHYAVTSYNGFNYKVLCKKSPFYISNVINTEIIKKINSDNSFKI